jgi:hypothetical protein
LILQLQLNLINQFFIFNFEFILNLNHVYRRQWTFIIFLKHLAKSILLIHFAQLIDIHLLKVVFKCWIVIIAILELILYFIYFFDILITFLNVFLFILIVRLVVYWTRLWHLFWRLDAFVYFNQVLRNRLINLIWGLIMLDFFLLLVAIKSLKILILQLKQTLELLLLQ